MQHWHHDRRVDIGLRAGGILLCGLSCLSVRGLIALHLPQAHDEPGVEAFAFAAAAFLCGSLGAVLLTLGRHIFDKVEISQRWATEYLLPTAPPSGPEAIQHVAQPAFYPSFNREHQRAFSFSRCA